MRSPSYLKKGDRVAIVAPARKVTSSEIEPAIHLLESWDLNVITGPYLYESFHQFAGTDAIRASDLQRMLNDDSVRAIFTARGGYGTVRIIDQLDFRRFIQHPKWIIGFSDTTVLHSHIHTNHCIETLHAAMPIHFGDPKMQTETFESLRKALFGEKISYTLPLSPLSRRGTARGKLVGGNLSLICSLTGTRSDINTSGKILLLEDLDEYLYHIDRMMMNLKRSGKLSGLAGLIVGGMTGMKDNETPFGKTAEEIVTEAVSEYDYPVCFNFPAGHLTDNRAWILGRDSYLAIENDVVFRQS